MRRVLSAALLGLTLALAPSVSLAVSGPPLIVRLGPHRFGRLSRPETVVARAGASAVGFQDPPGGPSVGPSSFDVGPDGSVWLLDQLNARLLVWARGRPAHVARTVPLPDIVRLAADIAVGPDRTIYLSYEPSHPPDARGRLKVSALSPGGRMRWTEDTDIEAFDSWLRVGPNGILYWAPAASTDTWTALTDASGGPLNLAAQRRSMRPSQPVGDNNFLGVDGISQHETRVSLLDGVGAVVSWWSLRSPTTMYANEATSALVAGDPVVPLLVQKTSGVSAPLAEYLVVRVADDGSIPVRLSLGDSAFGDTVVTGLRVGPDGSLYQLSTNPTSGVSIARYSLGAASFSPGAKPSSGSAIASGPAPSSPGGGSSAEAWVAVAVLALIALTLWLVRRRAVNGRHRARRRSSHDEP